MESAQLSGTESWGTPMLAFHQARNTKELIAIFDLMAYNNDDFAGKGTIFCDILDRKPM
jgi:hypothetical protein